MRTVVTTRVAEIQAAVEELSRDDFWAFHEWVMEHGSDRWDQEIEADARAGRLDHLIEQVDRDIREGRIIQGWPGERETLHKVRA